MNITPEFKTELVMVTPAIARAMLTYNTKNRDFREWKAALHLQTYQSGQWKLTHQGICFGASSL